MSVDALRHNAPTAAEPAEIAYLDSARTLHELPELPELPFEEVDELRMRLTTESSAGAAMLAAVLELERRLETERAELRRQRLENQRQWDEIHQLGCLLYQSERPLWRKLLNR